MHLRRLAFLMLLALMGPLTVVAADSAELVMYRRAGCPWCAAWDREIPPIYSKTEVGRRLPVRLVALEGERPRITLARPIMYPAPFVLVDKGGQVGRIEGYPGPDFFWGLLECLEAKLPRPATDGAGLPHRTIAASPSP
jgi:hypothetical protein